MIRLGNSNTEVKHASDVVSTAQAGKLRRCQPHLFFSFIKNNDEIFPEGFQTNHSGGILAGISNGEDIIARVHIKPIPSILKIQQTIDEDGNRAEISTKGRHDICAIPRINMVCEAMMAITLADHVLRQKIVR